nr:methyltransferase [Cellulomonas sp. APG4]
MPDGVPLDETERRALLARLRADVASARFTVGEVEELLGPVASAALHREQSVPALRATEAAADGAEALTTLLRTFVLGAVTTVGELDGALPTLGSGGAQALGLVTTAGADRGDLARAVVDLRPYAAVDAHGTTDTWLASDLGELATGGALRPDHVLGVGGASVTLAGATIRAPRRRTLDLGTGCGVQALHASRHSDAVVATDVSRRALHFAATNLELAGVGDRVALREGSMLEPVVGERFDLVVSNPPFVITPRRDDVPLYEYRDGGRSGDDLVRDLVTGLGDVLAPGGVAQLLGNWEHRRGEAWDERVGSWLDASGLDGWVVEREVLDPAEYAETWLRDGGTTADRDPAAWARGYEAWLDDLASRDVEAVGFGLLVLRRPVDGVVTMRRLERHTGQVRQPLGTHLGRVLTAHDLLRTLDDDALAGLRLTVAADVTEERHLRPGASDPTLVLLRQGDGLGRTVQAGTALAGLVGACDGELTVGQLVGGIAALLDVRADELAAEVLPQVRDLVRDGLLLAPHA